MESQQPTKARALAAAVTTGTLLALTVLYIGDGLSLSERELARMLFISILVSIILVSVFVYQVLQLGVHARSMAEEMARNRVTYSHELFSTLYRNSSVPFVVIDEVGEIESINAATAHLFHVELGALTGLNAFDFIEAGDSVKTGLIPDYFKQGKIVNDEEVELHRPDGTVRFVLLSVFSFNDADGKKKGLVTLIDITKQKMVDKAKTEFVSLASHQLRTPISGMKWNIELLLAAGREGLTPVQNAYIDKLAHGLERMDMLVSDFLSVSKLELGTLTPQLTSFDAADFLKTVYEELQPMAEKRKVHVQADIQGAEGVTTSDSHLLHMITSNLLSNAIKYTPEAGNVRLYAAFDEQRLTISIADTGMGIPASEQDMIFSKLFRASNAKTQVTDGTGLGLYIVREAVKILGGNIEFHSVEGQGTTFTVVLPK